MLEKITYDELPYSRRENKNLKFAEQAVKEFLSLNCDAVKITGWPVARNTSTYVSTLKKAIKEQCVTSSVSVHSDKDYAYLARRR